MANSELRASQVNEI